MIRNHIFRASLALLAPLAFGDPALSQQSSRAVNAMDCTNNSTLAFCQRCATTITTMTVVDGTCSGFWQCDDSRYQIQCKGDNCTLYSVDSSGLTYLDRTNYGGVCDSRRVQAQFCE